MPDDDDDEEEEEEEEEDAAAPETAADLPMAVRDMADMPPCDRMLPCTLCMVMDGWMELALALATAPRLLYCIDRLRIDLALGQSKDRPPGFHGNKHERTKRASEPCTLN